MADVRLENIVKYYGDLKVIKGINLEIKDGEFLVLVGPSGCGKTTILRMIAGLEDISDGKLYINDRLVNNVAPKDRDTAMVFQNYALYPHMNVRENIAFGIKLRKMPKNEVNKKIDEVVKILGLEEYLRRKPGQLSGGQRQRVALGRAIVREPEVFLLDEPLSNLDAKLRVQMRAEIIKLYKRLNATVVSVTHDQTEAMTMGTRLVVLHNGEIKQIGTPEEVYHSPENLFVAGFIGSPAMNLVNGSVTRESEKCFFTALPNLHVEFTEKQSKILTEKGYVGKNIILGIRPDYFDFVTSEGKNTIQPKLDVVENMGSEYYVYFNNTCNQEMTATLRMQVLPQVNDIITVKINVAKSHCFDPVNEQAIF